MLSSDMKKVMSELGKRSASKLTKEQRRERAVKAVTKRWEKYHDKKQIICQNQ